MDMKKAALTGLAIAIITATAGACSGPQISGPLTVKELRDMSGAGDLEGLAIVLYYEELPEAEARALYEKLLGLGMKDHLIEPGLGIGGPRMIMYRTERTAQAEWLKAHLWELRDYGLMEEKSATDIYINTW